MDVNEKLDELLDRTARLDVKQDALNANVEEIKNTMKSHVEKDEIRFVELETDFAQYKGAVKAWAWVVGVVAGAPLVWEGLSGLLHK